MLAKATHHNPAQELFFWLGFESSSPRSAASFEAWCLESRSSFSYSNPSSRSWASWYHWGRNWAKA